MKTRQLPLSTTPALRRTHARLSPLYWIGDWDFEAQCRLLGDPIARPHFASLVRALGLTLHPFDGTNMARFWLVGADLSGASLRGCNLPTLMDGVNLRRADLTDAVMSYTGLDKADLRDANLTRCRLDGTDLTTANTEGAKIDESI